jgi:Flp pilus assembly protein TadG
MSKLSKITIITCLTLIIVFIIIYLSSSHNDTDTVSDANDASSNTTKTEYVNKKIIHTESQIDTEVIEEGLTNMGFLITSKYYFTDTTTTSKVTSIGSITLGFTKANMIVKYSGYVPAGIDFTKITVTVDDDNKTIAVTIPEAELQDVIIDHDSFELLDEDKNIFNKFQVSDLNDSLIELEESNLKRAKELGILEEANSNAELIITNFVNSITDGTGYKLNIQKAE